MTDLQTFKQYFDPLFISYLTHKLTEVSFISSNASDIQVQAQHLLTLAASGKRIRPFIAALATYSAEISNKERLLPLLFSLELFHLFALIHDDIIDDSSTRRGVETFHIRYGRAQAVLWGDLCFSLAVETITTAPYTEETRILFSRMTQETIIGQMLDVSDHKETTLTTIIELKTARYTFVYPILLGLSVVGIYDADPLYYQLGTLLGRVFQAIDDISDETYTAEELKTKRVAILCDLCGARKIVGLLKIKKEHRALWCSYIDILETSL